VIACTVKLKPTPRQYRQLSRWLWRLTGVFNWTVRKIELDAKDRIYHSEYGLKDLVRGHGKKVGIPATVLQETITQAHGAWRKCFDEGHGKPRLKGSRNRLNSLVFREGKCIRVVGRRLHGFGAIGSFSFHKQIIPDGKIKRLRLVRRGSGWYGVLTIDVEPASITAGAGEVGIDPGFSSLLTLSSGEKIDRPTELSKTVLRLGQAQRGHRRRLTASLHERIGRQRKDRNHKLSRRLVSENKLIAWSNDRHSVFARRFGKSVQSAGHGQLREMLAYKSRAGGTRFVEVPYRNSTRRCSACQSLTGPAGWAGLKVRAWDCSACGAHHDRDVNAALNTLTLGRGTRHESSGDAASGIATQATRRYSRALLAVPRQEEGQKK
jgi:putative transposase